MTSATHEDALQITLEYTKVTWQLLLLSPPESSEARVVGLKARSMRTR